MNLANCTLNVRGHEIVSNLPEPPTFTVWYFRIVSDVIFDNAWGVLVLLKFWVNSQKLGVQAPQNVEFE